MSRVPEQTNCDKHPKPRGVKTKSATGLAGVIGGAAATLLVGVVALWEGKSNDPYKDIVGVTTVCYGDTKVEMRRYTDQECKNMLERRLVDYAEPVVKCTPNLVGRPEMLAAAVSLAYNIGPSAYCRSTVDRRFDAGNYRGGCDAMLMWNKAGGRVVKGLVNRRKYERELCLRGL